MNTGNSQIMNENMAYLSEWAKLNESFQRNLQVVGTQLICTELGIPETIDISNYYLPNILYNDNLREQLTIPNALSAADLFHIIRVNVLSDEILEMEEKEIRKPQLYITNLQIVKNANHEELIIFEDNMKHKYKLTHNVHLVKAIYDRLLKEQSYVSFEAFKNELEALNHEK